MPMRKFLALTLGLSIVATLGAAVPVVVQDQEDEEEKEEKDEEKMTLDEIMEEVASTNNRLNRSTRSPVTFRRADNGKDLVPMVERLVELGKMARKSDEALDDAKVELDDPKKKWEELMDDYIEQTEELVEACDSGDAAKAKEAHRAVKVACAECHKVFQHLDDDF